VGIRLSGIMTSKLPYDGPISERHSSSDNIEQRLRLNVVSVGKMENVSLKAERSRRRAINNVANVFK
jgi:hypothetical protein